MMVLSVILKIVAAISGLGLVLTAFMWGHAEGGDYTREGAYNKGFKEGSEAALKKGYDRGKSYAEVEIDVTRRENRLRLRLMEEENQKLRKQLAIQQELLEKKVLNDKKYPWGKATGGN